jgi:LPS sulfotransferase NodH
VNPYLFIVGATRSGNTLLQRLVDAHPAIAVVDETHWIPKWLARGKGLAPDGRVTPALVRRLTSYPRFARWQIPVASLEALVADGSQPTYAEFGSRFFDLYGAARGKVLVGDKTPRYVKDIPTLHGLWAQAKFIHIIRDGRDVCLSANAWRKAYKLQRRYPTWTSDPVAAAAAWWEWIVRLGRADGSQLGPERYYEVRYERLVADPAGECSALCRFLGVQYDDAMLRFHEGRTRVDPELDAKKAWRPVTSGLRQWRTQMRREDVERFEAVAGALLDELGYPLAAGSLDGAARAHATRIRASFHADLMMRGERAGGLDAVSVATEP